MTLDYLPDFGLLSPNVTRFSRVGPRRLPLARAITYFLFGHDMPAHFPTDEDLVFTSLVILPTEAMPHLPPVVAAEGYGLMAHVPGPPSPAPRPLIPRPRFPSTYPRDPAKGTSPRVRTQHGNFARACLLITRHYGLPDYAPVPFALRDPAGPTALDNIIHQDRTVIYYHNPATCKYEEYHVA